MNEEAISCIMQKMSNCLDDSQMIRLEKTLEEALRGEDIIPALVVAPIRVKCGRSSLMDLAVASLPSMMSMAKSSMAG